MSEQSPGTLPTSHDDPATGVVVGVDDSNSARAAVAWAAAAAERRGLDLHLVEVLPGPGVETGTPHGRARALLFRAQGIARSIGPDLTITMRTLSGRVGPALVGYAADASMLVVGSNGRGGPIPLSLGSILGEVTTHCGCPVIVVPVGVRRQAEDAPIMVALDDGPDGRRALAFAADTAERRGAALQVLAGADHDDRDEIARLRESRPGLEIRVESVSGPLDDALSTADTRAQLLVVAGRERGVSWARHFLPVLSTCPVAVVPSTSHTPSVPA